MITLNIGDDGGHKISYMLMTEVEMFANILIDSLTIYNILWTSHKMGYRSCIQTYTCNRGDMDKNSLGKSMKIIWLSVWKRVNKQLYNNTKNMTQSFTKWMVHCSDLPHG